MKDAPRTPPTRSLTDYRYWLRIGERGLAMLGLGTLLFFFTMRCNVVVSPSMQPTLQGTDWNNGDRVLTEKWSYWFRRPRRWEVIAYRSDDGATIMKRVIGLPGETIRMTRDGSLYVDGKVVPRPAHLEHLRYIPIAALAEGQEAACGDGYFVLGDHSRDSDDSRYNGPIAADSVVGRSWMIVRPWPRLGLVR